MKSENINHYEANPGFIKKIVVVIKKILSIRETMLFLIILLLAFTLANLSPHFLDVTNFRAISRGFAIEGIVIIGMTLLLVSGNFDLSIGAVMAFTGVMTGYFLKIGLPIPIAITGGILSGCLTGLINGLVVTRFKVNALITTLAMMSIARGVSLVITQGRPIAAFPVEFIFIGQGEVFGVPLPFIIFVGFVIVSDLLLRRGRYFRQLYFIGSNEDAARLSGIKVDRIKLIIFVLMGALAACGGVLSTARLMSAIPTAFVGLELKIIAAAVIGGASLKGGEGTVTGSIFGLLFMALISNAITILRVSPYWEGIVVGTVLLAAVILDMVSRQKK
jgi:ribose transport system permease protein